ncbi:unnamed protein product [Lupinus luteus]|uniref:Gnk2-homologous domain-containing protein n=1 Tax=Lupinus luteus TaxID=3873 RepID=A0AAV1YDJ1_LUPLU
MTYSANSKVSRNLKALLYSLITNSSQQNGEYSTIMGFGTTDAVNGLFLCRGDINTTLCQHCVTTSSTQITKHCPNQTEAVIWYDECLLRYTNKYFKYYSIQPRVNYQHGNKVFDVDFNQSLFVLLDALATNAANSMMAKKFATGQVEVNKSVTVYGLAQCSSTDMANSQCEICLRNAIGTLPAAQQGAAAMLASCVVRYELFPFYNTTGIETGTETPSSGGKKIQPVLVVIMVVLPIVLNNLFYSGYMSPEYAMHGQFSEKSDAFSFGVIVLEIVSAKRNARPIESQDYDDLLSMAWTQWRNQTPLEIMDSNLRDSFSESEVIKCIQIGLLCVNENPEDRPTMSTVVSYLGSLLVELPIPQETGFSMKQNITTGESSSGQSTNNSTAFSINDMTDSISFPR